ncbi:pyridoxamine 5'-phosphate oxidase family protein [Allorhizobium sp. BGMRC 0089]|uniref:pyridoxamine 5'-phosphate oxidase family protein n=1 Tax=Allorhizobium sonneratiae TaxID=2934936 RepID=UPI002033DC9B|nr:pyridoxamine 5'-phosphate oxidase family protein [Allorhizobium sonneratiae]MCM2292588.1 pyridoxamine 5'-phosphate oxidase family protein [Allorhizobium sonneratiae]
MAANSDIAFTPSVKAIQSMRGSRELYQKVEMDGGFRARIDDRLRAALSEANSAYLSTASATGQPYTQHRGGPRGFIQIIDDRTIGFADYSGNRQYITVGNLAENPQAFLFLMDYARRRRIKIWGSARVISDDNKLIERLMPEGYGARPEAAILFEITAWDINCPQHIPQKIDADLVAAALAERDAEIASLKAELAALKASKGDKP